MTRLPTPDEFWLAMRAHFDKADPTFGAPARRKLDA